jgi:hypothetical protein
MGESSIRILVAGKTVVYIIYMQCTNDGICPQEELCSKTNESSARTRKIAFYYHSRRWRFEKPVFGKIEQNLETIDSPYSRERERTTSYPNAMSFGRGELVVVVALLLTLPFTI